jgi:hypothetical protein
MPFLIIFRDSVLPLFLIAGIAALYQRVARPDIQQLANAAVLVFAGVRPKKEVCMELAVIRDSFCNWPRCFPGAEMLRGGRRKKKGRTKSGYRALVSALAVFLLLGPQMAPALENASVERMRRAAEEGSAKAQYHVGLMYSQGRNVPQDKQQAVAWYRKASEQGHVRAQYSLGLCYLNGRGVMRDGLEAAKWFRKAGNQGMARAQYNLGLLYDRGEGVAQNVPRAARWYRRAADQGFVKAQYNLGVVYERGRGAEDRDFERAASWYRKAADQGFAKAQHNLAGLYAQGKGVARNEVKAYALFSLAAAQGHSRATKNKKVLEKRMDGDELKKARELAKGMSKQ